MLSQGVPGNRARQSTQGWKLVLPHIDPHLLPGVLLAVYWQLHMAGTSLSITSTGRRSRVDVHREHGLPVLPAA